MRPIYFVKESEMEAARDIEKKLLELHPDSGILFVGVSVDPETSTSAALFNIWVGCSRDMDERMIPALVEVTLREEITRGLRVKVEAHRGVSRFIKQTKTMEGLLQVPPILQS